MLRSNADEADRVFAGDRKDLLKVEETVLERVFFKALMLAPTPPINRIQRLSLTRTIDNATGKINILRKKGNIFSSI